MLTFLPLEEIDAMDSWEGAQLNRAKEILAFELTKLVHGEEEATKAMKASKELFTGGGSTQHMPTTQLNADEMGILDILVACGLASSKGEGRRLVTQGGISVNDTKVTDFATVLKKADFEGGEAVIKKGKKVFHKVVF